MDSPAFAVNGMFSAVKVGNSSFTADAVSPASKPAAASGPRMAVDAFQRKFQSIGKINIDYSRPKKLATYKRTGADNVPTFEFPNAVSMAGHYSLTNCGSPSGATKILRKYDEYCAKGMLQTYKRAAIPYGVYTPKCTEGTVPFAAFDARVFNRTSAFRQAQKPVNVRLREAYEARKNCFILSHGCHREEQQFKEMPMSCATFLAGKTEALGACSRTVQPTSVVEDYFVGSVKAQMTAKAHPFGVYRIGVCMDGYAKGDAEQRRVVALASEYRASQQGPATITGQQYAAASLARQLFTKDCHHEEVQVCENPAVAAALCKY